MKILIPARGGSKRILNKNLVNLHGSPLISYAIKTSLDITDEVYVSTDSSEIENVAKKYGAKTIKRPLHLSTDFCPTAPVVNHFLETIGKVDNFVCVQTTSPLLTSDYIKKGIKKNINSNYDSIISVYREKQFCWNEGGIPINFSKEEKPRSQDLQSWYVENGAFYVTTKRSFMKYGSLIGGNIGFVLMPKIDSIDIDEHEDLEYVKTIMTGIGDRK